MALSTGLSRRAADAALAEGRVLLNGSPPSPGQDVTDKDEVRLDGKLLTASSKVHTIMLNKPVGYVCSRNGQGSKTIYDLLPDSLHHLKPVGRLDKQSSGLLLLTNDGQLAYNLTHPKFEKIKQYKIALSRDLDTNDFVSVTKAGVTLEDGISRLDLESINSQAKEWKVTMTEGRNRQIRRTFDALGYTVVKLHRTHFGPYQLKTLKPGSFMPV